MAVRTTLFRGKWPQENNDQRPSSNSIPMLYCRVLAMQGTKSWSWSFVSHRTFVPVTGVLLSNNHFRPVPWGWFCVMVAEQPRLACCMNPRAQGGNVAASISVCTVNVRKLVYLSEIAVHTTQLRRKWWRGKGPAAEVEFGTYVCSIVELQPHKPAMTGTKEQWGLKDCGQDWWLVWLKLCNRA